MKKRLLVRLDAFNNSNNRDNFIRVFVLLSLRRSIIIIVILSKEFVELLDNILNKRSIS